jgi:hypothetical protein
MLAVLRARAIAGEQDAADVGGGPSVLEDAQQLVNRVRPKRVEDVRPIECDAHCPVCLGPVVRQISQVFEARDLVP